MKKITILSVCLLLSAGCTPLPIEEVIHTEEPVKESDMKTSIDTQYGGFRLRFEMPEDAESVLLCPVKADHSEFAESTEVSAEYDSYDLYDLCAYVSQSNEWYEDMAVRLRFVNENGEAVKEEYSDVFRVTDFFCEEKERSVSGRMPYVFSYSSEGYMYIPAYQDEVISCTAVFDEDKAEFNAVWYDEKGMRKETDRLLSKEETDILTDFISEGQLVRKRVQDPSVLILDGTTPANYHLTLRDGDRLEDRWYDFSIEKSRQTELADFLLNLCHNS